MRIATFDDLLREAAPRERTVVCDGLVTRAFVYGGESFVSASVDGDIYVNVKSLGPNTEVRPYFTDDFLDKLNALQNAWLYRLAITDEKIPACVDEVDYILPDRGPLLCRQFMIHYLGDIGYYPACPDLREAMLHDLRWEIRGAAAESLGKIGDTSYTDDLIMVAREDKDSGVVHSALRALGNMKDESALPALKEMLEDGERDFHLGCFTNDRDLLMKGQRRIQDVSQTLAKIGGEAESILYEVLDDDNFWVGWSAAKGIEYSKLG